MLGLCHPPQRVEGEAEGEGEAAHRPRRLMAMLSGCEWVLVILSSPRALPQ